ncbi:MAG TPA: hypothetical protein VF735_17340 [Pyrinomonadaceae bacterium]
MKYLARFSISLLLCLSCAGALSAQETKCTLGSAQSPELRRLRLGMTADEARARYKVLEAEPEDEFHVTRLRLEAGDDQLTAEAVRDIAVELIRQKVVTIRLVYSPTEQWKDQGEFTEGLSKSLRLPLAWKPEKVGSAITGMMMQCAGFKISATLIGGRIPVVYLSALEAEPMLLRRQAEKERRLREFFKP